MPAFAPSIQISAPAQAPAKPELANVFYAGAVKFGPGAESMAAPTDFQGRMSQARESLELALEGEGGENQAEDAYERLMAMADENPAATVDELMRIIGRG